MWLHSVALSRPLTLSLDWEKPGRFLPTIVPRSTGELIHVRARAFRVDRWASPPGVRTAPAVADLFARHLLLYIPKLSIVANAALALFADMRRS